jgi:hypothetical protein
MLSVKSEIHFKIVAFVGPHTGESLRVKQRLIPNLFFPLCFPGISLAGALMVQTAAIADDRPHLGNQTEKVSDYAPPNDAGTVVPAEHSIPGALVAPGLSLPSTRRPYALENFGGKPELVHLKYKTVCQYSAVLSSCARQIQ